MKLPAFKEWDSVVRALGDGRQMIILRKGGIHEEKNLFKVRHQSFLLFPTFEHQVAEDLNEEGKEFLKSSVCGPKDNSKVTILYSARLEKDGYIKDFQALEKISCFHIFSAEGVRKKFEWGNETGLFILLVRVYRLPCSIEIPNLPQYGGCRSWLEIEIPHSEIPEDQPVLDDSSFQDSKEKILNILPGC